MNSSGVLAEANRLVAVCNSCGDCDDKCAVFPALELRSALRSGDLAYIANLCHDCGACYLDCELAAPHEFDINVPRVLALARAASYQAHAWPVRVSAFLRNGRIAVAALAGASVVMFALLFAAAERPPAAASFGPGAFYRAMPHGAMATLFGAVFVYACIAIALQAIGFARAIGEPARSLLNPTLLRQALQDAATLRYLGEDVGCFSAKDGFDSRRRLYHHLAFYGFALCFAATSVGTLHHYAFGREAPYPWWDAPTLLGTCGGLAIVVGASGLLLARFARDPILAPRADAAFVVMLILTALSGLMLAGLRATAAMPVLLPIHLGIVFALFLTLPYSKFVHGLYRFVALVRYARERAANV